MKESKSKYNFSKIFLEMFSVIFAIILALAANEWREEMAKEELANEAIIRIKNEILSNRDIVKRMLDLNINIAEKQKKAFEDIKKEISNDRSNRIEEQIFSKFYFAFMMETVKNTAWNSANLTHAVVYLDLNIVETLSATYKSQERYSRFNDEILERLSSFILFKKDTMKSGFQAYFMRLKMYFQITESLLEEYELCLKELNTVE